MLFRSENTLVADARVFSCIIGKFSGLPYDTKSPPGRITLRQYPVNSNRCPASAGADNALPALCTPGGKNPMSVSLPLGSLPAGIKSPPGDGWEALMNQRDMEGKMTGTFTGNARGFGFVQVEGQEEDLFIPEDMTGGAFHRDTVEVELLPEAGHRRREARVLQVLGRGMSQVVGTYEAARENYGFVVPDDPRFRRDIFIPREHTKGAVDGSKVVVKLTGYGGEGRNPEGMVQEVLGHVNDPGVDILSIVKGYELPMVFPEKVSNQAERVAKEVSQADMAGRRDLRDVLMVTIDGEDAKDLDDAVSVSFEIGRAHV